jgi:hypothetical protein
MLAREHRTWASSVNSQRGGCEKGANDIHKGDGHAPNLDVEVSDATAICHLS